MHRRQLLAVVPALGMMISAAGARDALAQSPPTRAYGTLSISGQSPAPGTVVQAYVRDQLCGEGQVRQVSEQIPLGYVVDVQGGSQKPGCAEEGDQIQFRVGGQPAAETGEFQAGSFIRVDLTVSARVATPTPGPTPPPFGADAPTPPPATATPAPTPAPTVVATAPAAGTPAPTPAPTEAASVTASPAASVTPDASVSPTARATASPTPEATLTPSTGTTVTATVSGTSGAFTATPLAPAAATRESGGSGGGVSGGALALIAAAVVTVAAVAAFLLFRGARSVE